MKTFYEPRYDSTITAKKGITDAGTAAAVGGLIVVLGKSFGLQIDVTEASVVIGAIPALLGIIKALKNWYKHRD